MRVKGYGFGMIKDRVIPTSLLGSNHMLCVFLTMYMYMCVYIYIHTLTPTSVEWHVHV